MRAAFNVKVLILSKCDWIKLQKLNIKGPNFNNNGKSRYLRSIERWQRESNQMEIVQEIKAQGLALNNGFSLDPQTLSLSYASS